MYQIYPDEGLVYVIARASDFGFYYRLFVNDVTPDRDTVLADLTQASWSGYAALLLSSASFPSTGVINHIGYMQATPKEFPNSSGSPQDAYGYYVTDVANSLLLAIGRFDDAPVTKEDGESFIIFPAWGDFSEQHGG